MTKPQPYPCKDGQLRIEIRTTVAEVADLGYIAFLGALHDDFDHGNVTPARFRRMVAEMLAYRGLRGGECWMDGLDDLDGDDYTAAKALATRAYGFDVATVRELI